MRAHGVRALTLVTTLLQDLLELERMQAALHAELNRKPTTAEWAAAAGMAVPAFSVRPHASRPSQAAPC